MQPRKFLEPGCALETIIPIKNTPTQVTIKFINPPRGPSGDIPAASLARLHSKKVGRCTVWIMDERNYQTVIIEVPEGLMSQYFRPHPHNLFPHFA